MSGDLDGLCLCMYFTYLDLIKSKSHNFVTSFCKTNCEKQTMSLWHCDDDNLQFFDKFKSISLLHFSC